LILGEYNTINAWGGSTGVRNLGRSTEWPILCLCLGLGWGSGGSRSLTRLFL